MPRGPGPRGKQIGKQGGKQGGTKTGGKGKPGGKGMTIKIQKKQQAKQQVRQNKAKKEKKRKFAALNPKEETIQEKLQRFERENEEHAAKRARTDVEAGHHTDDLEFFGDYGGGVMSFVENLNTNMIGHQKTKKMGTKRKDKKEAKNQEKEWEHTRVIPSWMDTSARLPVKKLDGTVLEASTVHPKGKKKAQEKHSEQEEDESEEEQGGSEDSGEQAPVYPLSVDADEEGENEEMLRLRLYHERQQKIAWVKEQIATIAHEVLEDPESKVKRMGELRAFSDTETDDFIKKLIVMSELSLYKDILPGYKIRIVEADSDVMISKEVAKVQNFEASLLKYYQKYLGYLDSVVTHASNKDLSNPKQENSLLAVCVRCLGDLLVSLPHFNFRANLIQTLIPMTNAPSPKIAVDAFENLFKDDRNSEASLEAVKKLETYIKARSYAIKPEVSVSSAKYSLYQILDALRMLPLTVELAEGVNIFTGFTPKTKKKDQPHLSKAQKKQLKIDKEVEREMKMAEAEESREHKRYNQTETLKTVFLIYFRIIRKTEIRTLLPTILRGLARFSHLVNIDLLFDMLSTIKEMILDPNTTVDNKLLCALTAFRTLKLQGQTLNVDLKDFYTSLYAILFEILSYASVERDIQANLLECFDLMFSMKKELVLDRVAAFSKRMLIICLYLPANGAIAVMSIVNTLLNRYPRVQQLLENEYCGTGEHKLELDDPEHCNPFAATLWEFALTNKHVNPVLKHLSTLISTQKEVAGNYTPLQLFTFYGPNDGEVRQKIAGLPMPNGPSYIHPEIPAPLPHPLEKLLKKYEQKKTDKDNLTKAWFIQPPARLAEGTPFLKNLECKVSEKFDAKYEKELFEEYYEDATNSVTVLN